MATTDYSGSLVGMHEIDMLIRRYRTMIPAVDAAAMNHQAILNDPTADIEVKRGAWLSKDQHRARAEWKEQYYEGRRCHELICFHTCWLSGICYFMQRCEKYPGYDNWRSENPSPYSQLRGSAGARADREDPAGKC